MGELASGSRIGVFEVTGLLGEGGMGKVYRARDTRLNRDVALKLLPDAFANDPDRLARFTREAQSLAALNHPHIAQIHGLEESTGVRALVMELVEGEDLAQRIARGPLPLDEALPIARQLAEALEAAHEQGIIHRDLKPANIKVTPDGIVKVLDFGLAKAVDPAAMSNPSAMNSPTLSVHATQAGVILGTAAYMSPEQARGRATDKRCDVWAFGCVLFEMLSGSRAFDGEDATEIIAAVVKTTPNWAVLPAAVPAHIVTLIQQCLEKDRKKRIGDLAVARFLMADSTTPAAAMAGPSSPSRPGAIAAGIAALLAVALAALAWVHFQEPPPAADVVRFQVPAPGDTAFADSWAVVSPDGKQVAFVAREPNGEPQLWVQPLDSLEARPLAGTANAAFHFWSPDSRFLGFATTNAGGRLRTVAVAGGAPQTLCTLPGPWRGGSWSESGVIAFGTLGGGLMQVPETGGEPVPLTSLDSGRQEAFHSAPWFLPDGRHFVYFRQAGGSSEHTGLYLGSLDASPDQQIKIPLVTNAYGPVYLPSSASRTGWLLFVREGTLVAQPFDPEAGALAGEPSSVAEGFPGSGPRPFSASLTGIVVYRSGGNNERRLTWFDRQGKSLGTAGEAGEFNSVSLSPDGTRVAMSRSESSGNAASELWTHELARGTSSRFTFHPGQDWLATWSPDGASIIFSADRAGNLDLYRKSASGAGQEEALFVSPGPEYAQDWSPDGRYLLYSHGGAGSLDLAVLDLEGERKEQNYLNSEFHESQGRFSPDGRFVAYMSNASGTDQIYVQTFPNPGGGKWMISRDGGVQPRWSRNGRELFFVSRESRMMAVEMSASDVLRPGNPAPLFEVPIWGGGQVNNVTRYDVTADGQRFLVNHESQRLTSPITVVLNWEQTLRR